MLPKNCIFEQPKIDFQTKNAEPFNTPKPETLKSDTDPKLASNDVSNDDQANNNEQKLDDSSPKREKEGEENE